MYAQSFGECVRVCFFPHIFASLNCRWWFAIDACTVHSRWCQINHITILYLNQTKTNIENELLCTYFQWFHNCWRSLFCRWFALSFCIVPLSIQFPANYLLQRRVHIKVKSLSISRFVRIHMSTAHISICLLFVATSLYCPNWDALIHL